MDHEELRPYEFVSMGIRCGANGERYTEIGVVQDNKIIKTYFFKYKRGECGVVGQVYSGAKFNDKQALGLGRAVWERTWHDNGEIIEWSALATQAERKYKKLLLAKDAEKIDEIERILLPLRMQYQRAFKRYDHATCGAIEDAMLVALRTPVRAREE